MKLKLYSGRIIRITAFVLLFCLFLQIGNYVFQNKFNHELLSTFVYEEENSLDVLFLGSSHVYRTVLPADLWNEYGIPSYNLGTSQQSLPQSYYVLKMALERQKPRLVVLDLYMLHLEGKTSSEERTHQVFDNLPRSLNWYKGVFDIVPREDLIYHLAPFFAYHERWTDLDRRDFKPPEGNQKGSHYTVGIEVFDPFTIAAENETDAIPAVSLEYLQKIIDLCRENEIDLQLVVYPYPTPSEYEQRLFNAAAQLAEEQGIPFENMLDDYDELDIRLDMDFADIEHLNLMGALKITRHLGKWLQESYRLPDRRNEEAYSVWNDSCREYTDERLEALGNLSEEAQSVIFPFLENWYAAES